MCTLFPGDPGTIGFPAGLLLVENSNYSDCKSAIEAIEFISQRIPTVASDGARTFNRSRPALT